MDFATELLGLQGKKAVVIGGGQGMGESISTLLARAGADVAVLDRERDRAERVAGAIATFGKKVVPLTADMLDPAKNVAAIAEAEKALGGMDVLVSIVGQALFTPLLDMTLEEWDFDHNRNLRYFFVAAQAAAKSMMKRGKPGAMACVAVWMRSSKK